MMVFRHVIILLFAFTLCSCVSIPPKEHLHKKYLGIYFDHGAWTGAHYTDKNGHAFLYRSISTTITNDSTIPIQLKLNLLSEYTCSTSFSEGNLKLFILPKRLTGEKQYDSGISKELNIFLDSEINNPSSLNEIIKPKEESTITIGILNDHKNHKPFQMALISNRHHPYFIYHDSIITETVSKNSLLSVSLALDYVNVGNEYVACPYLIIPCGHISFIKK